jgi:hypothetical protein
MLARLMPYPCCKRYPAIGHLPTTSRGQVKAMNIDQENNDTVLADSHDINNCDIPEPLEYWSLDDFQDLIPHNL